MRHAGGAFSVCVHVIKNVHLNENKINSNCVYTIDSMNSGIPLGFLTYHIHLCICEGAHYT